MREAIASAPGKVNLTLRVGEPQPDGYHPLVTVFEALDLREYVHVRTSRTPGIRVHTNARLRDGSIDEVTTTLMATVDTREHLAFRAARVLQRLAKDGPWGSTASGVDITVTKYVPVAGGMAGGSADAAATLVACNALWGLELGPDQLQLIGRTLGADVPACLVGGLCLGTGRGDHMRVLTGGYDNDPNAPIHHWVLALSDTGLSTPEVFTALDRAGGPAGRWLPLSEPTTAQIEALTGQAHTLAGALVNDLQEAAFSLRPELESTLTAARQAGALGAVLCGSGPTVAVLARDSEHATLLAQTLADNPHIRQTVQACGPVEGARLEQGSLDGEGAF